MPTVCRIPPSVPLGHRPGRLMGFWKSPWVAFLLLLFLPIAHGECPGANYLNTVEGQLPQSSTCYLYACCTTGTSVGTYPYSYQGYSYYANVVARNTGAASNGQMCSGDTSFNPPAVSPTDCLTACQTYLWVFFFMGIQPRWRAGIPPTTG